MKLLKFSFSVQARQHGLQSHISGAAWLLKTCYCANNMGAESIGNSSFQEVGNFEPLFSSNESLTGGFQVMTADGGDSHKRYLSRCFKE